jgi:hypothetical protein
MGAWVCVSEAARRLGVPPRTISDLFYQRKLDGSKCPVMGGRLRVIPEEYLEVIRRVLAREDRRRSEEKARREARGKAKK